MIPGTKSTRSKKLIKKFREKMYVTRPLSMYLRDPSMVTLPPPEGPNSGILVIQDEEAEPTVCFGLCKGHELHDLPFPQNKNLKLRYSTGVGENRHVSHFYTAFIPVLNQPLASNRYYAIQSRGRLKGQAYTCSTEEDLGTCCCCTFVKDVPSQPFNPNNIYQQFEIQLKGRFNRGFVAKAIASDGYTPKFLGRKGWEIYTSTPRDFDLGDAPGLDTALRARLPDFDFPLSFTSSNPVVVGKWYCPFMFIKEGTPKDQMSRTRYYEMTLEQRWEQIFACDSSNSEGKAVVVDVSVQSEYVAVAGNVEAVHEERDVANGLMWYRGFNNVGGESGVGLSLAIVERMKWEQQRFGWFVGNEKQVRVNKVEEFGGMGGWRRFSCYVLVERFVLKRMDGSVVLTHGFRHTHHIRSKWE
ncbi:PREDICTED: uncharacterized protein LOC103341974 [Prunus mume]|uniref:Uncharacterized protein LOC103341974 n=1 Tax=Prunus mume TaxID=102107 RepID=A0ABM0PSC0_PRUMU|nr:PREDICTED: uncharacterized protein LOC103341974 [Prunus mume]